ncbi:hypothetical protein KEJ39_07425 [Candidatus Bathyarchaeota archaeon]|nr:hypothetical protein [Candidatus Bathyarchaeota archaeon]
MSGRVRPSEELLRIGLRPVPSEANFMIVGLPEGVDSDGFTEELVSRGVIVRSLKGLAGFSVEFFRVTVAPERRIEYSSRLARVLQGQRSAER